MYILMEGEGELWEEVEEKAGIEIFSWCCGCLRFLRFFRVVYIFFGFFFLAISVCGFLLVN